jgi:hypothetical protein
MVIILIEDALIVYITDSEELSVFFLCEASYRNKSVQIKMRWMANRTSVGYRSSLLRKNVLIL